MIRLEDTRVDLPGTTNVRDLGGLPIAGGRIAPRRLYRAEALAYPGASDVHAIWDRAHAARYRALGIRTVIDLRSVHEAELTPSAWGEATGARIIPVPIAEGGEGSDTNYVRQLLTGQRNSFDADDLARFYIDMIEGRARTFGTAIKLLAAPGHLPALVHCSAGKDRTGILIALLLDALGTPRDLIVRDYTLTGIFRPNRVNAYAARLTAAGITPNSVRALFETPASALQTTLTHLDQTHGGPLPYLTTTAALPPTTLPTLHTSLLP